MYYVFRRFIEYIDQILYNVRVNNVSKICPSGDLVKTYTFTVTVVV